MKKHVALFAFLILPLIKAEAATTSVSADSALIRLFMAGKPYDGLPHHFEGRTLKGGAKCKITLSKHTVSPEFRSSQERYDYMTISMRVLQPDGDYSSSLALNTVTDSFQDLEVVTSEDQVDIRVAIQCNHDSGLKACRNYRLSLQKREDGKLSLKFPSYPNLTNPSTEEKSLGIDPCIFDPSSPQLAARAQALPTTQAKKVGEPELMARPLALPATRALKEVDAIQGADEQVVHGEVLSH